MRPRSEHGRRLARPRLLPPVGRRTAARAHRPGGALGGGCAHPRRRRPGPDCGSHGRERHRDLQPPVRARAQLSRNDRDYLRADGGGRALGRRRGLERRPHGARLRRVRRRGRRSGDDGADSGAGRRRLTTRRGAPRRARRGASRRWRKPPLPRLVERGGGAAHSGADTPRARHRLHVHVDCRDAMGANMVNTVAEAVAAASSSRRRPARPAHPHRTCCDCRCVRARARVPPRRSPPRTWTARTCATASSPPRASPRSIPTAPPRTTRAS